MNFDDLARYPLVESLLERRSRRFGKGMTLPGGPLTYRSSQAPQPLSLDEESALAFAACGITGHALAELPYDSGGDSEAGGGNIMIRFIGRTVASGHALHYVTLFVINDEGTWMIRRPQDFQATELESLIRQARDREFRSIYEKSRVRIADRRLDVPRQKPFVPPFNKWSANLPGTTYFLPVNEFTADYINVLLAAFSEELGYFILDERNGFRPAGIAPFSRSRGGHLDDDPRHALVATVGFFETWLCEFASIEQGGMLQNLGLMTQALGLGGFPHFAAHPFIWFQTLGFRMQEIPFSRIIGAGRIKSRVIQLMRRDLPVPTAVGLEHDGDVLIKPYCPPYYRNMEEAVLSFIDSKYAAGMGTFRDGGALTAWKNPSSIQSAIPKYSDKAIAATIAYCDYIYQRYGRFPTISGPFRTILAYQAHRLDTEFYDKFYRPESLSSTQRARESV
jgi:hypothetical protein